MKSAFLTGPKTIELRDVPDPKAPRDGLVLSMRACGVCGSDLRRYQEGPPAGVSHLVQGHELAGEVVETGPEQTGFKAGDRLALAPDIHCGECYYCRRSLFNLCIRLKLLGITAGLDGGFAEKIVLTGEVLRNGIVHRMPEQLSYVEAGMSETLSSVLASHSKCQTSLGETVVVMGAGPIGCLHTVVAQARGARVIVIEPNATRRKGAEKFRPSHTLDPNATNPVKAVRELTGGVGADVVICANPVASTQTQAVEMSRRGGRVVLFGGLPKANPMTQLDGNLIHYGEIMVVGAFSYHPSFHAQALEVLASRRVDASLFVTHTLPLSKTGEAFEIARSGEALKVMVVPD